MKKVIILAILIISFIAIQPVVHAETLNLIYDANGNLISGDVLYREYNSLNQLELIRNGSNSTDPIIQEFYYHPTEERIWVKKTYLPYNETVIYVSDTFVKVINDTTEYNCTYVMHNCQQIAQECTNGLVKYIHSDHLGSSTVVTDGAGQAVENTTYSPYGEIVNGGEGVRYTYEGKEYDDLTGHYDFHFRQFNPETGLFGQPDTLIQNVYDPQSLNRYMFERGNPYGNVDKDGHWIDSIIDGIGLVADIILLYDEPSSSNAIYVGLDVIDLIIDPGIIPPAWGNLARAYSTGRKGMTINSIYEAGRKIVNGEIEEYEINNEIPNIQNVEPLIHAPIALPRFTWNIHAGKLMLVSKNYYSNLGISNVRKQKDGSIKYTQKSKKTYDIFEVTSTENKEGTRDVRYVRQRKTCALGSCKKN